MNALEIIILSVFTEDVPAIFKFYGKKTITFAAQMHVVYE